MAKIKQITQSISYCKKKRPRLKVVYDPEETESENEVPSTSINVQCINKDSGNGNIWTEIERDLSVFELRGKD